MSVKYIGGPFSLVDHFDRPVTNESFLGRHALLFFGFTHCRKICPAALQRISEALAAIGPIAAQIQPLYISVDPERDTPAVLKAFLETSYPVFLGLTGNQDQVDTMKAAYKVFAKRVEDAAEPDGYAMPHTAFTYLIGPDGLYVAHFTDAIDHAEMAARLRKLIATPIHS